MFGHGLWCKIGEQPQTEQTWTQRYSQRTLDVQKAVGDPAAVFFRCEILSKD